MSELINIVVPLVVGLVLVFVGFAFSKKNKKLTSSGIEVEGIIFSTEASSDSNSSSAFPIIRFVTKEGLWITEKADVGLPPFLLKKGKSVKVFYNPDNPKEFIYKTSIDVSMISYFFIVFGIVIFIAGAWLAYQYLIKEK